VETASIELVGMASSVTRHRGRPPSRGDGVEDRADGLRLHSEGAPPKK